MKLNLTRWSIIAAPIAVKSFSTPHSTISKPLQTCDRELSSTSLHAMDVVTTANMVGNTIDGFYQSQPYLSAFVTCSFKATAADIVVQSQGEERKIEEVEQMELEEKPSSTEFDFQRTLSFLLYGGFYQGCVQEYIFTQLFPSIFGDSKSLLTVIAQVATDMMLLSPFICLPVAYLVKATIDTNQNLLDGLQRYMRDIQNEGVLYKYWAFWIPVQFLTFGVLPTHLRVAFIAFASFFWLIVLSSIAGPKNQIVEE